MQCKAYCDAVSFKYFAVEVCLLRMGLSEQKSPSQGPYTKSTIYLLHRQSFTWKSHKSSNLISKSQTGRIRLQSTLIMTLVPLTFRQIFHTCSKKTPMKKKKHNHCSRDPMGNPGYDFPAWFFISFTLL